MQRRVLLVRHGSYSFLDRGLGGRGDFALSEQGRAEAERAGIWLLRYHPVAIVSSPVQRARETADLIALRLGHPVQVDAAFAEIEFAAWSGKRFEDLDRDPAWHAWNRFRSTARVPGGESILEVQLRAVTGLLHHAALHPEGDLAVVSHADVIKAVLMHFLGCPLDMMRRIEISPGSLSELVLYSQDAKVLAINIRP
jgi:broad specificity phosphatase PhoE